GKYCAYLFFVPSVQNDGCASRVRVIPVTHTRPLPSIIGVSGATWSWMMISSPQVGDGRSIVWLVNVWMRLLSTFVGIGISSLVVFTGSSTISESLWKSAAYTGPFWLLLAPNFVLLTTSWMNAVGFDTSHTVTTMLRSSPAGRGGAGGISPAA